MSTYLRRRGRLTRSQAQALEDHGPSAIIPPDLKEHLDFPARFGRPAPVGLEIGFGTGQSLLEWAEAAPDWNLLGIEIYEPGIGNLLKERALRELDHVMVIQEEAALVLQTMVPPDSLSEVRIFFPDPWPKKKHQKRRLVSPSFVELLGTTMQPGARLRLATDWQDYASWMLKVLEVAPMFSNEHDSGYAPRFEARNITRFEARGQRLGHQVWDLSYLKQ